MWRTGNNFLDYINSYAWYQLLSGDFAGAKATVQKGVDLYPENEYFYTNLPPALLLQGKYKAAKKEYIKYKDRAWTASADYKNYAEVFLDDFATFEEEGIIPESLKADVAKIRAMLGE